MLKVENLTVRFHNRPTPSAENVTFTVGEGECFGFVGESGSGKSVTALAIAGLHDPAACTVTGAITLDGAPLGKAPSREVGIVFQEPSAALDPLMRIGDQVEEPLLLRGVGDRAERRAKAEEAMRLAELRDPAALYAKYPFQLSGGMLQRVMLASALVTRPRLLLLDEPTTALDVTTQAEIVALLRRLNREEGIAMLFISHDLSLVRKLCPRVAVMCKGRLVETGETEALFRAPNDPYTQTLIASIPEGRRSS